MKYVASCSFGKDSMATIILAHINGEPLDEIIYAEVMFSTEISGEVPEHRDFIYNLAIPLLESWGYCIKVLKADTTFLDSFHHILVRGKNEGKKRGFPYFAGCNISRDCKMRPINNYWKTQNEDIVQYVGIATDEPSRLERLRGTNKISLLEKYGYTEEMARQLCKEYGLLSPIYNFARRNGCWFCPNAGKAELRHLYFKHPDFVNYLLALEKTENMQSAGTQFSRDGTPSQVFDGFQYEGEQIDLLDIF